MSGEIQMNGLSRRRLLGGAAAGAVAHWPGAGRYRRRAPPRHRWGSAFGKGFVWGTATAAYQIEGAVTEDGRKPSIWDTFSHTPGRTRDNATGDVADDHYHRWSSDLDLMKSLGLTGYRFPVRGRASCRTVSAQPEGDRLLQTARRRAVPTGITPMVTLFHWDLPQVLQDKGGWENRDCAK